MGNIFEFYDWSCFFYFIGNQYYKRIQGRSFFDLGVVTGDIIFIAIAYLGSFRLIQSLKDKPALFIFGGILMLAYGIISFISLRKEKKINTKEIDKEILKKDYFSLFIKGLFLNIINIGVLGFWLAVIISVGPKLEMQTSRMMTFFSTVIITYLLVDCIKILLAKQLKSKMTPSNILRIKKGISIVLMFFGLVLIVQGWFPKEKEMVKQAFERIEKQ